MLMKTAFSLLAKRFIDYEEEKIFFKGAIL